MLGETLYLSELQPGYFKSQPIGGKGVQRHCTLEIDLPWYRKYILAIHFFAAVIGKELSYQRSCSTSLFPFDLCLKFCVALVLALLHLYVSSTFEVFQIWNISCWKALVIICILGVQFLLGHC